MTVKNIALAVLAVLFLIFFFQNMEPVPVQIFFWTFALSKTLVLAVTLLVGLVAGWVLKSVRSRKGRTRTSRTAAQR